MTFVVSGALGVGILSTGSSLPVQMVTNAEVARRYGVSEDWILRSTGVRTRHRAAASESAELLAVLAAARALASARVLASEVEWLVVVSSSPVAAGMVAAATVRQEIGAVRAVSFDVRPSECGFLLGLLTGAQLTGASGGYGLVVGVDVHSPLADDTDPLVAGLFGDGAGAVVLGPVALDHGILSAGVSPGPDLASLLPGGWTPPGACDSEMELAHVLSGAREQNPGAHRRIVGQLVASFTELLEKVRQEPEEIRHVVPHQFSGALLADMVPALGLPQAAFHLTADQHGNTGAASVPLALDAARRAGVLAQGDLVLITAFSGCSTAQVLVRWGHG